VNAGKVIVVGKKFFLLVFLLSSSSLLLGADSLCYIDKELNKDTANKLKEVRSQTHSICLNCSGDSCTLKSWPTEKSNDAAICKLLFCTPSRVSRVFKLPEGAENGKSLISFDYFITDKGKIKGIDITNVKGSMNDRQAYKYLTSFAKKTSFEPLKIDGRNYQLSNLSGQVIAVVGSPDDVNKYQANDTGIWRN
tara:strand:- start:375 stop:956 length:582 start_codon:yes stop_codon:yes gene_type:complete